MKKLFIGFLTLLLASATLSAQTPQEIIARMEQETGRFDTEGFSMVMEMKIPLLGTYSTTMYARGDKYKGVIDVKGEVLSTWSDGVTNWSYDASKNELTISNANVSEGNDADNANALKGVTDGYDVKLKKETDDAWFFICTKSKTNANKDDPKKMDLVVAKNSYLPLSASIKEKGITVTMRDFAVGVSEEEVTFDPSKYASAKLIDKR